MAENKKNIMTYEGLKALEDELQDLKVNRRREVAQKIKEAREQGDLSENFEYQAAKREKNRNESRIRYLERMVKTAKVIKDHSKDDEVGLNNTVTVYFEDDDAEEVYKIVTTIRSDALKQMISIESPMGKALMKHKTGDRVYVKVNDKVGYYVVIKKIEKSDDESEGIKGF